jgi:hypothetical protein
MAWCGPDFTVVSVGPDAEGDSRLMCMGTTSSVLRAERSRKALRARSSSGNNRLPCVCLLLL